MEDLLSLREIDRHHGVPKGTAFRAFRALEPNLVEGRDYVYLPAGDSAIEALRAAGRLYPSTVNAVLLTARGYERLRERLP